MSIIASSTLFSAAGGGGGGGGAQLTNGTYSYPGENTAQMIFARNGPLTVSGNISGSTSLVNWWLPSTTNVGDAYEVKCTLTSGAFLLGTSGAWKQLNTGRTYSVDEDSAATYTCQIRRIADLVVVASATFTLSTV